MGLSHADDRPELRHGAYVEKEGPLLLKGIQVPETPVSPLHEPDRYVKIQGSNMKCFLRSDDPVPEWELPLQNAHVEGFPDKKEIHIRVWDTVKEFETDTSESFQEWFSAMKKASEKNIKDYYAFVRILGEGLFGTILLAKDRRTREKFAVKVIKKQHTEVRSQTLIHREMSILRLVNHPNVARLYDLFDTKDKLYFVLEYLPGGALYEVLSTDDTIFSEESASQILKDILQGLEYLHSKGIVHRDIQPENILTTSLKWPYQSKLADFGLSNFLGKAGFLESEMETTHFCARELFTGEKYNAKADMWSLGVVAFEMLSGHKPFESTSEKSLLQAILDGKWGFDAQEWQTISDEAKDFISQLICIDVDLRLSAADALKHPWITRGGRPAPIPNRMGGKERNKRPPKPTEEDDALEDDHDEDAE